LHRDLNEPKFKALPLTDLTEIRLGSDTGGFRRAGKHLDPLAFARSFTLNFNKGQSLELEASTQEFRTRFLQILKLVLRKHKLHPSVIE
jgi:hypothetical protein